MPALAARCLNNSLQYWLPLSVTSCCGNSNRHEWSYSALAADLALISGHGYNSKYQLKLSISTTIYVFSLSSEGNGPIVSMMSSKWVLRMIIYILKL